MSERTTKETAKRPAKGRHEPMGYDQTIALIAALVHGDRWLNADACAVYLGMLTPKGSPNRRGFLERIACQPGFPKPLQTGAQKSWKKSEVDNWAEEQRRSAQE